MRSGGPIKAITDLSMNSINLGLHSEVIGPGPFSLPETEFPFPRDLVHVMPNPHLGTYGYCSGYRSWFRSNLRRFDGVVLHGMWNYGNLIAHQECLSMGIPYAWFPHGMLDPYCMNNGLWKTAKKRVYWFLFEHRVCSRARAVFFTTSRELTNTKGALSAIQGLRRVVVPYGISGSPSFAGWSPNPLFNEFVNGKYCLFLGRLDPIKNIEFLLKCWQGAGIDSKWHLVIAGAGDEGYVNSLHRLVRDRQIGDRVHFVNHVYGQDKSFLLGHAQWFLLPSSHENFGIAVLEAIKERCPVVISDQVYLADNLPSSAQVLPLTEDAWVRFFKDKLDDDALRASAAEDLHRHVSGDFDMERISRKWVECLTGLFRET